MLEKLWAKVVSQFCFSVNQRATNIYMEGRNPFQVVHAKTPRSATFRFLGACCTEQAITKRIRTFDNATEAGLLVNIW